jgi:putative ABC transport system permease protein
VGIYELTGAIEIGLIYGLVAVYLSFRILDFPDMTVDGSFPMGAGIAAILITTGYSPWLATILAIVGGAAAGLVTASLNVYGRILHLLASIITMTALYSINLRIMGKSNISLYNEITIFEQIDQILKNMGFSLPDKTSVILLCFTLLVTVVAGVYWFMKTQTGLSIRATGKNQQMATAQGIKTNVMILTCLALSNSLAALSGAIYAQSQTVADINMGPGTIMTGLAAVIIGEAILPTRSVLLGLLACIFGAIAYRIVVALALNGDVLGLAAADMKLVEAVLIASAMLFSHVRRSFKSLLLTGQRG